MVAAEADGAGAAAQPSFKRATLTKGRIKTLREPGHHYASFDRDDAALKTDWASLTAVQKEGALDKIGVYAVADLGSLAWLKKVAGMLGKSGPDLASHLDENTRTNEARYFDVLEWLGGGERPFPSVVRYPARCPHLVPRPPLLAPFHCGATNVYFRLPSPVPRGSDGSL